MSFNPKRPSERLKKRVRKKYPKVTAKNIRMFIYVWNNVFKKTKDEGEAYEAAWGVLKKKMKKKSSLSKIAFVWQSKY